MLSLAVSWGALLIPRSTDLARTQSGDPQTFDGTPQILLEHYHFFGATLYMAYAIPGSKAGMQITGASPGQLSSLSIEVQKLVTNTRSQSVMMIAGIPIPSLSWKIVNGPPTGGLAEGLETGLSSAWYTFNGRIPLSPVWPWFAFQWGAWSACFGASHSALRWSVRAWRVRRGRCPQCGYHVGVRGASRCPECGWDLGS